MEWPPDVMRRQRIGDLYVIVDAQVQRLRKAERERVTR
jgi:hypothetical protein